MGSERSTGRTTRRATSGGVNEAEMRYLRPCKLGSSSSGQTKTTMLRVTVNTERLPSVGASGATELLWLRHRRGEIS